MKKYEKLILLIIGMFLLTRIGILLRDIMTVYYFGAEELTYLDSKILGTITSIITSLVNVGCGVWLFVESGRNKLTKWIWSIFGLLFGLFGIAIYYLVAIYNEFNKRQET